MPKATMYSTMGTFKDFQACALLQINIIFADFLWCSLQANRVDASNEHTQQ